AEDIAAWPELGIMGEFATAFDPENLERTYNLKLSTNSINGYVLLPGEIFSFNRVVGPRTPARGYKQADVIVSGRLVPDYGGGVCQVSSTLYNAVLRADLQVIERQNHSLILNYIEPGTDATVSYGYLDFSFKNSTKSPVVLGAWVEDNRVEIALLGRVQTGKSVEIKTNVLERTDPPVEYREDPSLPLGQKVVERWGAPDLLVETLKIVSQDGEVVREQLVSRDRYNNAPRIIRVGTGEEVVETVECFANTVSEEACL
ncbi:MAG: VanW family protein, partial [Bacillota bacterium]